MAGSVEPQALSILVILALNPDHFEGGKENFPVAKVLLLMLIYHV